MGIMDRDYWKDKHRQNNDKKVVDLHYNPKQFRGSSDVKHSNKGRWIVGALMVATAVATIIVERGWMPEALIRRAQVLVEKNDGNIVEAAKTAASAKTIIPGIISTAQTGFLEDFKDVVIEFNPSQLIGASYRYGTSHDFYATTEKRQGSISYRVLSGKPDSKKIKGEVTMHMWGFGSAIFGENSRRTPQICPETIRQSSKMDDEKKCGVELATGMARQIETENGKAIKLKLKQTQEREIRGYYINEVGQEEFVGGFKLREGDSINKVMTHTLHFKGMVSDCGEVEPVILEISSVKNNGKWGESFLHKTNQEFACKDQVKSRMKGGRIIHEVRENK